MPALCSYAACPFSAGGGTRVRPCKEWRMPRAWLPLKNERRQTALQKAAKRTVESHLSQRERWPFAKPVFLFLFMEAFLSCCAAAWQHVISYLDQLRPKSVCLFMLNCVDLQRKRFARTWKRKRNGKKNHAKALNVCKKSLTLPMRHACNRLAAA